MRYAHFGRRDVGLHGGRVGAEVRCVSGRTRLEQPRTAAGTADTRDRSIVLVVRARWLADVSALAVHERSGDVYDWIVGARDVCAVDADHRLVFVPRAYVQLWVGSDQRDPDVLPVPCSVRSQVLGG